MVVGTACGFVSSSYGPCWDGLSQPGCGRMIDAAHGVTVSVWRAPGMGGREVARGGEAHELEGWCPVSG